MPDHPEGNYLHSDLDDRDHRIWHLGVYLRCLENPGMLDIAIKQATAEYTVDYGSEKKRLRLGGLELLREMDHGR
jgi:hypothetical protein